MRKALNALQYFVLGAVTLASAWGCSTMQEPMALSQARTTFMQAQQTPQIATNAPVAMRDAEQTLRHAEQVWVKDQDEEEVQHLAYVTERQVEMARATSQQKEAEADIKRLAEERDRLLLDSRARQAQQAQQSAQQATARATQLEQELKALQAKETERGLELTLGDVLFEVNEATLKPGAMRNLYQLAEFLKQNSTRNILIEGHTDSTGSETYNLELSQRRAEAVADFLINNGVSPNRITARGHGEAYPVASNDSTAGRQRNRRVDMVVLR